MTRLRHHNPPRRELDPARALRDSREPRAHLKLDELIQMASPYEEVARQTQQKIESGAKVYPFELGWLNHWKRLIGEIAQRQGL